MKRFLKKLLRPFQDLGSPSLFVILAVILPLAALALRKSIAETVTIRVWEQWSEHTMKDKQNRSLADLMRDNEKDRATALLKETVEKYQGQAKGKEYEWATTIRSMKVWDAEKEFAVWPVAVPHTSDKEFQSIKVPIKDSAGKNVGMLEVDQQPSYFGVRARHELIKIQVLYDLVPAIVCVLVGLSGLIMLARHVRETAALHRRLKQEQQSRIDFAQQMLHEFGGALATFQREGKNIRLFSETVKKFFAVYPAALEGAVAQNNLDPVLSSRIRMVFERKLAAEQVHLDELQKNCGYMELVCIQLDRFLEYMDFTLGKLDAALLGKTEGGRIKSISPRAAWEHICGLLAFRFERAGITIHTDFDGPEDEETILGEAGALQQVFFNIVKNAVEAMESSPGPRELVFQTRAFDDRVECSICNSGAPIPAEVLARIFDKGWTTKATGKGLGLSVAHDFVRQMGGTIDVTSNAKEGTTFLLRFLRQRAAVIPTQVAVEV